MKPRSTRSEEPEISSFALDLDAGRGRAADEREEPRRSAVSPKPGRTATIRHYVVHEEPETGL